MENYPYPSYPDSGDSSPRSREIECENPVAWEEPAPAASTRVKLMCSYGGRIQPRPHDNQLSYVGGETKILAVDRSIRFPAIISRLASLLPQVSATAPDDFCFKYQLPGEDLDALISVTNDEDLEHMMLEYDRLHRTATKPAPRLRLFLFQLVNSANGAPTAEQKSDRQWFVEALNSMPLQQPALPVDAASVQTTAAAVTVTTTTSPDFLFGLDKGFVPPPAVKIKNPAPEPVVPEPLTVEVPARSDLAKEDRLAGGEAAVSPPEIQWQIQELRRLQIAENQQQQQQQQAGFQRNGSDETLFYLARAPEVAPPPVTAAQIQSSYWPEQRSMAAGRYASVAGGDQPVYLIPAAHGVYPGAGVHQQAYYTAVQRMLPADPYRESPAVYTMAPAQPSKVVGPQYPEGGVGGGGVVRSPPGGEATGFPAPQVAYDSAGRAVYYTSAVPTYQTVTSVGPMNPEGNKVVKPPQVS